MTYHRAKQKRSRQIIVLVVVLFVLALLSLTPLYQRLSEGTQRVAVFAWSSASVAGGYVESIFSVFAKKEKLIEENKRLRTEIESMRIKTIDRNLLWEENIVLRGYLGKKETDDSFKVLGRIVAGFGRGAYNTLIIDVGLGSGVEVGDLVLVNSIVVGEIGEVFSGSSKIKLYSSSREVVDIIIGSNNIPAKAIGRGAGNFEIKLPRDTEVFIGDIIQTSGDPLKIIGIIEHVDGLSNDPLKTVLFKHPVNIFEVEWVKIIRNKIN